MAVGIFVYNWHFWVSQSLEQLLMVFFDIKDRILCPLSVIRICWCAFLMMDLILPSMKSWYIGTWRKFDSLRYFERWSFVNLLLNWQIHLCILYQKVWSGNSNDTCFFQIVLNICWRMQFSDFEAQHYENMAAIKSCFVISKHNVEIQ